MAKKIKINRTNYKMVKMVPQPDEDGLVFDTELSVWADTSGMIYSQSTLTGSTIGTTHCNGDWYWQVEVPPGESRKNFKNADDDPADLCEHIVKLKIENKRLKTENERLEHKLLKKMPL